jgi:hypothetical protein
MRCITTLLEAISENKILRISLTHSQWFLSIGVRLQVTWTKLGRLLFFGTSHQSTYDYKQRFLIPVCISLYEFYRQLFDLGTVMY